MWRFKEAELNWVKTNILRISELRQLEIGISTSRYLPAIGTAGLERSRVRGYSLEPCPPPKIIDKMCGDRIFFILIQNKGSCISLRHVAMKNPVSSSSGGCCIVFVVVYTGPVPAVLPWKYPGVPPIKNEYRSLPCL